MSNTESQIDVTVIVAAYNAEGLITQALKSAVAQDDVKVEILVVDDASTDGTADLVEKLARSEPRIQLIRSPERGGAGHARNLALDQAKGQWIAVLDADDIFQADRLTSLLAVVRDWDADMVADNLCFVDSSSRQVFDLMLHPENISAPQVISAEEFVRNDQPLNIKRKYGLLKPIIRRDFINRYGIRYNEETPYGEDFLLYIECLIHGAKLVLIPQAYYFYELSRTQMTRKTSISQAESFLYHCDALLHRDDVGSTPGLGRALTERSSQLRSDLVYLRFMTLLKRGHLFKAFRVLVLRSDQAKYIAVHIKRSATLRIRQRFAGFKAHLISRKEVQYVAEQSSVPSIKTVAMRSTRPQLVHICGFPSSGTDLLSNFMSAHSDIHVRGEFPLLPKLARKFGSMVSPEKIPDVVNALKAGDVWGNFLKPSPTLDDRLSDGYAIAVADIYAPMVTNRDVKWCGNKTPQNTENLSQLLILFPETRIVFITRDIRDVCLSWRRKWGKDLYMCAAKWNGRMAKGLKVVDSMPEDRVLRLHFENLITDPGVVGQKISQFLGVDYDECFLNYHQNVHVNPGGKKNFGKPIDSANLGKWRQELSETDARRIEEISYPMMVRFGYEPEFARKHRRLTPIEFCVGLVAELYAVFFVGNRYDQNNHFRDRLNNLRISFRYRFGRG